MKSLLIKLSVSASLALILWAMFLSTSYITLNKTVFLVLMTRGGEVVPVGNVLV